MQIKNFNITDKYLIINNKIITAYKTDESLRVKEIADCVNTFFIAKH